MKRFEEQCKQANAFKGKKQSLRSFVVEYHPCGDWINDNEVMMKRSAGISLGCRYMVKTLLLQKSCGECYDLERCFATIDDAEAYANYMRDVASISEASVYKMKDRGVGNLYRYDGLSVVALIDFEHPAKSFFGEAWRVRHS